ncbi:o-succinylbenzoate synthase [Chlorobaculum sp. MV4-Y]|uniref:o-succinylbenzoate synthase n=1 Tax=Chlorobaculum sp. MV4-Y TaxID=2976335 RepID=UPI0021AFC06D|nr:o-succinylbenzoate synthase [Chlorobaculum sp. MV4-Y]UWX57265.1 o-succinylbenzoate synthase [Chlorobaculum sp. MV4-Y]
MKPLHAEICWYEMDFTAPVTVRGVLLAKREGLLLRLKSEEATAYGEVAPLTGLHAESLDEALQALTVFLPELSRLDQNTPDKRRRLIDEAALPPSVATGIEMALINLEAVESGSLPSFPAAFPPASMIPVNALLAGDAQAVLDRATKRYAEGFRAFKLKVRKGQLDEAIASIRALHEAFGGKAELRLDANQSLELDEALRFGKALPNGSISYIEEPLTDAALIPEFHAATGLPSALDESLWQRPELLDEIGPEPLGALVLKPNCIGGIAKSLDFAAKAQRMGLQAVFSSAFESSVSLGIYALLAAVSSPAPAASGLDTASFLASDLTETPFSAPEGFADPARAWRDSLRVRPEMIEIVKSWTL